MGSFLNSLFGKEDSPKAGAKPSPPMPLVSPPLKLDRVYQAGEVIGSLGEVIRILGEGGFGVVYLLEKGVTKELCALKSIKDDLLCDQNTRIAFEKEALLWVKLGSHPCIISARQVRTFWSRVFVEMDYVLPDANGCVTLADHLRCTNGPLPLDLILKWGIQFCAGMQHAQQHGLVCHRDIKPGNILIHKGDLRISDFGLASAVGNALRSLSGQFRSVVTGDEKRGFTCSVIKDGVRVRCGTPGYMAPEVYSLEGTDVRSDVYSFGLVLWQMVTGSRLPPFTAPYDGDIEHYLRAIYQQQISRRSPRVDGPLKSIVLRCIQPDPSRRYLNFGELQLDIESVLRAAGGAAPVFVKKIEDDLSALIREAGALRDMERHEEAIQCYDKAVQIEPENTKTLHAKAACLAQMGQKERALECYEYVIARDPANRDALTSIATLLRKLGRHEEAQQYLTRRLVLEDRSYVDWLDRAILLMQWSRLDEAVNCLNEALKLNPHSTYTLLQKAIILRTQKRYEEAIECCDIALAANSRDPTAWLWKGGLLYLMGRMEEALLCYDTGLQIDNTSASDWSLKGHILRKLSRYDEAVLAFSKAIEIDPRDSGRWYVKALLEDRLHDNAGAAHSFAKFLELAGPAVNQARIEHARARLHDLRKRQ